MAEHRAAQWSKKGALVELFGHIGLNVYTNANGEAKGNLIFHTTHIKIFAFAKEGSKKVTQNVPAQDKNENRPDDLPYEYH